jgi:cytochrome c
MNGGIAFLPSTVLATLVSVMCSAVVMAAQGLDGPDLYLKYNCQICHGKQGEGGVRNGYPVIQGQDKLYLIQQMKDIRDGVRENGQAKLMRPLIVELTDEEIRLIATFLNESRVTGTVYLTPARHSPDRN